MINTISSYNQVPRVNLQSSKYGVLEFHQKNKQDLSFKGSPLDASDCKIILKDYPPRIYKSAVNAVISGIVAMISGMGTFLADKFDYGTAEFICGAIAAISASWLLGSSLFAFSLNNEVKKCK